jgi:hypothetical protein
MSSIPVDFVEKLLKEVEEQTHDLKTVLVEIHEMWAEISSRFGDVLDVPGMPASLVAEYLADSTEQLKFMQRATTLLEARDEINRRNEREQATKKIARLNRGLANIDQTRAKQVFDRETAAAFLAFKETIDTYPAALSELQLSVYLAVYSPFFGIHDAFAAYLDRPRPSATIWDVATRLFDTAVLRFLGKANSLLGPIKAIAQAMHKHTEGAYEKFKTGVEQQVLFARLRAAVDEARTAIDNAEAFIAACRVSEDALNERFDNAAKRITDVLDFFAKSKGLAS